MYVVIVVFVVPDPNLHVLMPDFIVHTCFATDPVFQRAEKRFGGKYLIWIFFFKKLPKHSRFKSNTTFHSFFLFFDLYLRVRLDIFTQSFWKKTFPKSSLLSIIHHIFSALVEGDSACAACWF